MKHFTAANLFWLIISLTSHAQTFDAKSLGTDGDLAFPNAKPNDVIIFDPKNTTLFPNGLDPDGDNVYHFRTITIPAQVTVKLRARYLNGPVTWLAQGNVSILGTLDLSGEDGNPSGSNSATTAVPGPGGFYGGAGGDSGTRPPTAGYGPLGGAAPPNSTCTYANGLQLGGGGGASVNQFLVPLIGGSGGGGYPRGAPTTGEGGGAGGGAILIASKGTISIQGSILAGGGRAGTNSAGSGAGGSVRLASTRIEGNGTLSVRGGLSNTAQAACQHGKDGLARLEAFQQAFNGTPGGRFAYGTPFDTFVNLPTLPTIRILSVAGVAVASQPTGSFEVPDVSINSEAPVPVVIQTTNIPAGTIVRLQVFSEDAPTQSVEFPGLPANGTATVNVKWPTGFSRGFVRASFVR